MRPFALAAVLSVAAAFAADPVLLSTRREGYIEAFSLDKLETVARVHVKARLEGIEAGPGGDRFFVRAPHPQAAEVCCALWAFDTRRLHGFAILWPSLGLAQSGGRIFTQRADDGVEEFDSRTVTHYPMLRSAGVYQLAPSPDGRWLFGARQFPMAALDLFDLAAQKLVRSFPVPEAALLHGVWVGAQYYAIAPGLPGAMRVWPVNPEAESLGAPKLMRVPGAGCSDSDDFDLVAAADRIALFHRFGTKAAPECSAAGYVLLDGSAATASPRFAPNERFESLVAGPDGKTLYGVAQPDPPAKGMQLLKIDAASGNTLTSRNLPADFWTLTLGAIPPEWQGRLDLQAVFQ
jgi:hypothetical protein